MKGKMSNESPIGKAAMGKKKGEQIVVKAPAGLVTYKIVKIS
jgi:transcription elongation factor GreA